MHPSADGYATAVAGAVLPTAIAALGVTDERRVPTTTEGVQALPRAALAAAERAGTEVSGASVGGRERGPGGRWAALRTRVRQVIRPGETPTTDLDTVNNTTPAES